MIKKRHTIEATMYQANEEGFSTKIFHPNQKWNLQCLAVHILGCFLLGPLLLFFFSLIFYLVLYFGSCIWTLNSFYRCDELHQLEGNGVKGYIVDGDKHQ